MNTKPIYSPSIAKTIQCPQCGYPLELYFKYSKLIACRSCKSSIFLEDDGSINVGQSSTLTQEPSFLHLNEAIEIEGKIYIPLGFVRYSYGRGFWEEWFLKSIEGYEFWLSVDEGDMVLETRANLEKKFTSFSKIDDLSRHKRYDGYVVSEIGIGECVGFEGELPRRIDIAKRHKYAHLSKGGTTNVTIEEDEEGNKSYFIGNWIDIFSIKKVQS